MRKSARAATTSRSRSVLISTSEPAACSKSSIPAVAAISAKQAQRIIAVQVIPKNEASSTAKLDNKNVVYQTVSLDGIENVPRVLLEGDVVRFVVPANDAL